VYRLKVSGISLQWSLAEFLPRFRPARQRLGMKNRACSLLLADSEFKDRLMRTRTMALPGAGVWVLAMAATVCGAAAEVRAAPNEAADLVGSPRALAIAPTSVSLKGRRATGQLIATASYAVGTVRDLTRASAWTSLNPDVASVTANGRVTPKA